MATRTTAPDSRAVLWQPKQHSVVRSIQQYSKFVAIMKIALPASAAILLLLVLVLPIVRTKDDSFPGGTTSDADGRESILSMTNARFYGTNDKGEPYSLTAHGVRQVTGSRVVQLNLPKAEITLTNGTSMSASADTAMYDREAEIIDLDGNVVLLQDQGYELHTSHARISLKDGTAHGETTITGHGPFGSLEAAGFDYGKNDKAIRFTGRSRLLINSDVKSQPSDAAPPNAAGAKP